MQEQQKQLVDRLKQAQNILVTVTKNPSVDQLAAAIGLTLALNHLDKHATAVFSGQVPNTLEFLKPEDTLEKNTDSLRDFIIALDKSKADKLRYKVEDDVVRIFITPYKTSISEKDLDFSQGDFNVDVVVALGVRDQQDLDEAITAHGRILHDATVASINLSSEGAALGSIIWTEPSASSLSELVVGLADELDKKVLDSQIATALLTGIVSATERFRNDKTSPKTMSVSAALMAAGANQQLIATQLETPTEPEAQPDKSEEEVVTTPEGDGESGTEASEHDEAEAPKPPTDTLEIDHEDKQSEDQGVMENHDEPEPPYVPPLAELSPEAPPQPQVDVDESGHLTVPSETPLPEISKVRGIPMPDGERDTTNESSSENQTGAFEPPEHSSEPAVNAFADDIDSGSEGLTLPSLNTPVLNHDVSAFAELPLPSLPPMSDQPGATPFDQTVVTATPSARAKGAPAVAAAPAETLADIEHNVESPHLDTAPLVAVQDVDNIRNAVEAAYQNGVDGGSGGEKPPLDLNALPLGSELHETPPAAPTVPQPPVQNLQPAPFNPGFSEPTPGNSPADQTLDMPLPQNAFGGQSAANNQFIPAPQSTNFQVPGAPLSSFPGVPPQTPVDNSSTPPPPVPPPMLPPLQ